MRVTQLKVIVRSKSKPVVAARDARDAPGMVAPFRTAVRMALGLLLAATATAALCADYVVVGSTDPAIARGSAYDAGARIALAPGRTVTLMHASGAMVSLKGSDRGAVAPTQRATDSDANRMAVLRFLMSDADKPAVSRTLRTRGGICPPPEALTSLDAIAQAQQAGCTTGATQALELWLKPRIEAAPDPDPVQAPS